MYRALTVPLALTTAYASTRQSHPAIPRSTSRDPQEDGKIWSDTWNRIELVGAAGLPERAVSVCREERLLKCRSLLGPRKLASSRSSKAVGPRGASEADDRGGHEAGEREMRRTIPVSAVHLEMCLSLSPLALLRGPPHPARSTLVLVHHGVRRCQAGHQYERARREPG